MASDDSSKLGGSVDGAIITSLHIWSRSSRGSVMKEGMLRVEIAIHVSEMVSNLRLSTVVGVVEYLYRGAPDQLM